MPPFMAVATIAVLVMPRWRWLAGLLEGILIALVIAETIAGQHFPYQKPKNPWLEHMWPSWRSGGIERNLVKAIGLPSYYSPILLLVGWEFSCE